MAKAADKSTALWVIRRLRRAGYEALLAGGCVRDMLLGLRSSDYDVATSATPREVKRIFRHVLLIGAKFGVAMVVRHRRMVEVATFRSDLSYSDGRRPDGVRFATAAEDARRRDFTINGMFYDPEAREVIDHVGGRDDLAAGVIRTIGRAHERFAEDYLRMIRAARFAVRLGFAIAPATARAVRKHAAKITAISGERIFDELSKMLSAASAGAALRTMDELALARHVLAELFAEDGLWPAAVGRVEAVARRKDLTLTLAAMLCDLPPRTIGRMVRRWGGSNDLRGALEWLASNADGWRTAPKASLAEFRKVTAHAQFGRLRAIWRVREIAATGAERHSRRIARRAAALPGGAVLPEPFVKGTDLLAMGMPPGRQLGKLLRELYDAQLDLAVRSRTEAMKRAAAACRELGRRS